jgi:hypothetical protein
MKFIVFFPRLSMSASVSLTWMPAYYRNLFTTASSKTKSIARSLINLSSTPMTQSKRLAEKQKTNLSGNRNAKKGPMCHMKGNYHEVVRGHWIYARNVDRAGGAGLRDPTRKP